MGDVTVITPAAKYDLALPELVMEELELDFGTHGRVIGGMIKQASGAAQRYCDRVFAQERVREVLYNSMYLSRAPVSEIHEVTNASGNVVDSTGYRLMNAEHGRFQYPFTGSSAPYHSARRLSRIADVEVTVEYTGGYILPGMDGRTLPHDIERACIEIVKAWYLRRNLDRNVLSETIGDYSYRIADPSAVSGIPAEAQVLLDAYKRLAIA